MRLETEKIKAQDKAGLRIIIADPKNDAYTRRRANRELARREKLETEQNNVPNGLSPTLQT